MALFVSGEMNNIAIIDETGTLYIIYIFRFLLAPFTPFQQFPILKSVFRIRSLLALLEEKRSLLVALKNALCVINDPGDQ